jgi:transposase InsO family protein
VIRCPGFYTPTLETRLFSPQVYLATGAKGGSYLVKEDRSVLCFKSGQTITMPLDPVTKLFYTHCFHDVQKQANELAQSLGLTHDSNTNLSPGQKRLLRWHHALVHIGFTTVRHIGKLGWLGTKGLSLGDPHISTPLCASCQYGKGHKRSTQATRSISRPETTGAITKNNLSPGDLVSMDHIVIRQAGRRFESRDRESEDKMFHGGTIFVDAASGRIKVKFQRGLSAPETLQSKMEFEREALSNGVTIKAYRTDNGTFTAQSVIDHIKDSDQTISFSGVGAQHQNGVAERAVKTVCEATRTIMLHAALRWPEAYDSSLWPMAMNYAIDILNEVPRGTFTLSPEEVFSSSVGTHSRLLNAKAWGCPTYVLEPKLQNSVKLPKWSPRTRRGQFLGFSPLHSSTVGLIRNLRTGSITPQFHCVYDSEFETTFASEESPPSCWQDLVIEHRYASLLDEDSPISLAEEWLSPTEIAARQDRASVRLPSSPPIPSGDSVPVSSVPPVVPAPLTPLLSPPRLSPPDPALVSEGEQPVLPQVETTPDRVVPTTPAPILRRSPTKSPAISSPTSGQRRSTRTRFKPQRLIEDDKWGTYAEQLSAHLFLHSVQAGYRHSKYTDHAYLAFVLHDWHHGLQEDFLVQDMFAFKAKKGQDPDSPSFIQAMSSDEREYWIEAIKVELSDLEKRGTWVEISEDMLPEGANVVPGTWVFKVKRFPDGRFRKFKARLCVRGDLQLEGVDFFKTYAPVVSWLSVRVCLVLSAVLDLQTVQADYSNAFAQAFLEEEIYMKLPQGCSGKFGSKSVLKLQRSLYGLRQAAACWFDKLRDGLLALGWHQPLPDLEPCLFVKDGIICLVYVDDCLFFGKQREKIHAMIAEIEGAGFTLTIEEDVYAFLGVEVKFNATDGTVSLTQPGLLKKIISMTGLQDSNSKATPAEKDPLGPGLDDDPPHDEDWEYPSVIGCLLYLANNTRPDIQFAVHSCARYTHRPKAIHSKAVKRIVRYLVGTADKGLLLRPSTDITIDMYVDADFAGMWQAAAPVDDPVRVKSRTGYLILLANCPLVWASKLQTEIATSTLEAEFIALSTGMRELIPARTIFHALAKSIGLDVPEQASLRSTVFEDNNGCLTLATVPKMTPRTKHIGVKYFWFRSKVGPGSGITIKKVDTKAQLADTLTKGLPAEQFATLRTQLMGWTCSVREGVSRYGYVSGMSEIVRSLVENYMTIGHNGKTVVSVPSTGLEI